MAVPSSRDGTLAISLGQGGRGDSSASYYLSQWGVFLSRIYRLPRFSRVASKLLIFRRLNSAMKNPRMHGLGVLRLLFCPPPHLFLAVILYLTSQLALASPSIDCAKPQTVVEASICRSPGELSIYNTLPVPKVKNFEAIGIRFMFVPPNGNSLLSFSRGELENQCVYEIEKLENDVEIKFKKLQDSMSFNYELFKNYLVYGPEGGEHGIADIVSNDVRVIIIVFRNNYQYRVLNFSRYNKETVDGLLNDLPIEVSGETLRDLIKSVRVSGKQVVSTSTPSSCKDDDLFK